MNEGCQSSCQTDQVSILFPPLDISIIYCLMCHDSPAIMSTILICIVFLAHLIQLRVLLASVSLRGTNMKVSGCINFGLRRIYKGSTKDWSRQDAA